MGYARGTTVPSERSQAEIRKILSGHGATAFAFAESSSMSMVQFEMKGKRIKFAMPMPVYMKDTDKQNRFLSKPQIEQRIREKWRALTLAIKAKLECVASGITTFETEFMAQILLPNGQTVGEAVLPEIESSYKNREMPALLGMR